MGILLMVNLFKMQKSKDNYNELGSRLFFKLFFFKWLNKILKRLKNHWTMTKEWKYLIKAKYPNQMGPTI